MTATPAHHRAHHARHARRGVLTTATLSTVALLSACGAVVDKDAATTAGGSSPSVAAGQGSCDPKAPLHDKVPASVKQAGCSLTVSSSGAYAPMNFFDKDGKTIIGLQPDLATAIEKQLGVKITYVVANFDAVLGGIASGRYDTAMMTMTDNAERRQKVDFVDYGTAGSSILVQAGNPKGIKAVEDLCGLTVSAVTGYYQVDQLTAQSKTCTQAGKKPITIMQFPNQPNADQAVATTRADAQLGDTVNAAWSADKSGGKLEVLETLVEPAPFGMPFRKDRKDLAQAVEAAFTAILDNGEYAAAAQKWNLSSVVPDKITVNDGAGF